MKKKLTTACALCLVIALCTGVGAALPPDVGDQPPAAQQPVARQPSASEHLGSAEPMPAEVAYSPDRLEIRKIYELSPDFDPGRLPRGSFERGGFSYECADILREVVIGEELKAVTVTETAESRRNDSDSVLALLPQYKEYADEDGYAGTLLLNTATIRSEVSGYGSTSTPYTVSRSYPNLSDADTQHIPKTIEDGGRTLQLQDVEWRTDNTYNADDYEIGDRYTAIATYAGTQTSSYVRGYDITADYSGEVSKRGVTAIRYTVIFIGAEIPAAPEAPPEPEPPEENPAEAEPPPDEGAIPAEKQNGAPIWIPLLISALALLGSAACVYFTIKNRKEQPRYEKVHDYNYPDTYADSTGGDAGPGCGDS